MSSYKNILLLFCFLPGLVQAQSLRGLQENPAIKEQRSRNNPNLKSAANVSQLYLPFFEDFSTSDVFPDPAKWSDQYVYINNSFAVDPVSVGVATFDAIDKNGNVYAVTGNPVSSDTLTSHEFDLSVYQGSGLTVRLSFFYQCGGRGEVPELNDSLVLEYYHPVEDSWQQVWQATLNEPSEFEQVILVIAEDYYINGFRFRFRNYTSLSADEVSGGEGALSNADCWNIDYILLNTDKEENHITINNDITITDIPRNVLDFYETVPWLHVNSAVAANIARNSIIYGIRNYMPEGDSSNIGRSFYVRNHNTGTFQDYQPPWDEELPNGVLVFRPLPLIASLSRNDNFNESVIEIASYLRTLDFGPKENDTSRVLLHFRDSYVYDDGSPEFGFGIEGPSMTGALLAVRFRIYQPDTLRALDMYFNKAHNRYNELLPFQLCIWKDGGGKPGDLIYISEESYYPDFSSPVPSFKRYPILSAEDIIVSDTVIYAGWKQQTDEFLNLGYDVNNDNLSRTFVNIGGDWISPGGSLIPGTVMIRAVFGNKGVVTNSDPMPEKEWDVIAFPNPASHLIHINADEKISTISLVDISGRIVLQLTGDHQTIDVSPLSPGMYHIILFSGKKTPIIKKIIISR